MAVISNNKVPKGTGADVTGLSEGMIYDSGTNIGIGTTSPALKLHVSGGSFGAYGAADGTGVRIDGGASGAMVKLFSDYLSPTGSDINLHLSTYGNRNDDGGITIDTAGKVGIGTTSPGARLHVRAPTSVSATLRIDAPTDGYDSYAFFSQNNVTKGMIGFDDSDDVFKVARNFDNADICIGSGGNVGIGTSNPGYKLEVSGSASIDGSTLVVDATNDKVGIGLTGPAAKLHVESNSNSEPTLKVRGTGTADMVNISGTSATCTFSQAGSFEIQTSGSPELSLYNTSYPYEGSAIAFRSLAGGNKQTDFMIGIFEDDASHDFFLSLAKSDLQNESFLSINQSGGNVGIGETDPDSKLEVNGTIHATNLDGGAINLTANASGQIIRDPSDRSLKKNIKKLSGSLDKVTQMRGVTFEWKAAAEMGEGTAYGMIAQEVEKVVPELVSKSTDGIMGVRYTNMVGLLIEAIKEQQAQIEKLQKEVEKLNKRK